MVLMSSINEVNHLVKASDVFFFVLLIIAFTFIVNTQPVKSVENSWTTETPMPTARAQLGVAVVNGKIYAIGGGNNTAAGPTLLNVNEEYDPATNTWETKTAMPTARAGLSANTVNGRIYLMGGDPGNTTNEAYDPVTDSWTTESQIPLGASGSASAVVGSKIYLFGGIFNRNATQIFDTTTGTWTKGLPIPVGVAEGAAAATSGVDVPVRIYVMGGEITYVRNGETYGNVTDLNQVYDPETNSWSMGAPLPSVLRFFGLAVVNDTLYAMGGFPLLIDFLNTNYEYTPLGYGEAAQPGPWFVSPAGIAIIASAIGVVAASMAYVLYKRYRARYQSRT